MRNTERRQAESVISQVAHFRHVLLYPTVEHAVIFASATRHVEHVVLDPAIQVALSSILSYRAFALLLRKLMPWQKHQNLRKLLLKLHRQFFLPHEKAATLMAQLKTQMGTSVVFSNVFYVGIGNIHYSQNCSFDE